MPQSFASLHVHIVFSTKHRQPFLDSELRPRLFEYVGGIARQHECALIAAGGTADHVHLLASLGRSISIADAVRVIKTNSSGWIHTEFKELRDFQWQQGYGAFAVSFSNLDAVKQYLASQEEHHRKRSYQDEFRELLRRHGLEWDERYVWD
jgi:REP element-mobilizing transposase RayT